jgi:predicted ribosomally synthesized peptide with nif11-like leader
MPSNQLAEFLEAIRTSPSIREKLRQASDAEATAIAEIAREAGLEIPLEELKRRGCWWEQLPQQ